MGPGHMLPGCAMAYLDPTQSFLASTALSASAPRLSGLERDVLLLSRRDDLASLDGPRWHHRFRMLRVPTVLADPRLEALRRFAVLFRRHGDRIAQAEEDRLVAMGYSAGQIAQIRDHIRREPRKPHRFRRI